MSGTDFLLLYLCLSALCFAWMWVWRQRLIDTGHLAEKLKLNECELAMLNGGTRLATTTAAIRLRETGVLAARGRGRVEIRHRPKGHARRLERDLYDALSGAPDARVGKLSRNVASGPAARNLRENLVAKGLMLGPWQERQARWLWLLAMPLLGLGVARLVAGLSNHKPIGNLTAVLCLVVIVTVIAARDRPLATRAGQAALSNERAKHPNWRSTRDLRPSLGVALFGPEALWRLDPVFAAAWRVARPGLGNWRDAYLPERAADWNDGGFTGGGFGDGGGG